MDKTSHTKFYELKIIVIGTVGTGKTSFVNKWTKNVRHNDTYKATIVSEFSSKIYQYKERNFRVQIWDIGGLDRNRAVAKTFAKDSYGCLIMASCDNHGSLNEAVNWKKTIEDCMDEIPCILIENKCDLLDDDDLSNTTELMRVKEENGFLWAFRTSVKTEVNINETMDFLLKHIIESIDTKGDKIKEDIDERDSVVIDDKDKSKKKCCN